MNMIKTVWIEMKNVNLIENLCGKKPIGFVDVDIASDPNYIFESDPDFGKVTLSDYDGNSVIVNSYLECKHYVEGGWDFLPRVISETDLLNAIALFSIISVVAITTIFIRRKKIEFN